MIHGRLLGKPHKVMLVEESTRRPDAGLMDKSLVPLAIPITTSYNLLVFCRFRLLNCKRKQQNWDEFKTRFMVDEKNP
jgi:hypothetical protein